MKSGFMLKSASSWLIGLIALTITHQAWAQAQCFSLSADSGPVGTEVTVSGAFPVPDSLFYVSINGEPGQGVTTGPDGTFTPFPITIPLDTPPGPITIELWDSDGVSCSATFTVIGVVLNPSSGFPGSTCEASVYGGTPGGNVEFFVNNSSSPAATGVFDTSGDCSAVVTISPSDPQGPVPITALDLLSGSTFAAQFQVSFLEITPASGTANTLFTLFDAHFSPNEEAFLDENSVEFGNEVANTHGDIEFLFYIPSVAVPGVNTVTATGQTSQITASATFTLIAPTVTPELLT
jgi:hypothetical protein